MDPFPVEVAHDLPSGRGRGLVTTSAVQPGALLLAQQPYAWVLNDEQVALRCDHCAAVCSPPLRCAGCRLARYCSAAHQRAAWEAGHRGECGALRACAPRVPPPTVRLLARVLWRAQRERAAAGRLRDGSSGSGSSGSGSSGGGALGGGTFGDVEALVTHWGAVGAARKVQYAQMAAFALGYMRGGGGDQRAGATSSGASSSGSGGSGDGIDGGAVRAAALLLARFAANCHTVCDAELRPLGNGLYPRAALANHGEPAAAAQRFRGPVIEFRALRALAPGDEVTIAYVEMAAPRLERRAALRARYFFDLDGGGSGGCDSGNGGDTSSCREGDTGGANGGDGGGGSGALWSARDVALWGAAPTWSEALGEDTAPGNANGRNSSGNSSGTGSPAEPTANGAAWIVHGFGGPSLAPPWRQDAQDAEMCRVSAWVPAGAAAAAAAAASRASHASTEGVGAQQRRGAEVPLPGGLLVLEDAAAGDAAAIAEALGPVAAESFALGEEEEEADGEGGGVPGGAAAPTSAAAVAVAKTAAAAAASTGTAPPRMRVLQWGDWASALGSSSSGSGGSSSSSGGGSSSTRALALAAARQLRRAFCLQARAQRLVAAGRAGEAADALVAALGSVACTPPAVASAATAAAAAAARGAAAVSTARHVAGGDPPADAITTIALGPRHAFAQRLLAALLSAAVDAGDRWPLALAAAEALQACYAAAYPRVWPNRGLHGALVAKLRLLLERPGRALRAADAALESLRVTHGGGGGGGGGDVLDEVLRLRAQAAHEVQAAKGARPRGLNATAEAVIDDCDDGGA